MRAAERTAALIAAFCLAAGQAFAGGPIAVRSNGFPFVWPTGTIIYRTDNGPLSPTVDESAIRARVIASFDVWQSVPTSSISYARATTDGGNGVGFINPTGAFAGGDVNTAVEFAAIDASCGSGAQNPVVYDADGTILADLGADTGSVIGIAAPCSLSGADIMSGFVVLNGRFQDGQQNPEISPARFDAAVIHEIGHFSGLDHSQINVNCYGMVGCGADDLAGVPTMFPFLLDASQGQLSVDDVAWISRLYPDASFATTHGTISGVVFFTDGQSHAQFVNVIARPLDTGANQDRTSAVSVISGYRFRAIHGNPLTGDGPSPFGTTAPGDIGLFEIPVPAGSYTIQVESVHPDFTDGSGIGDYQIAMPGTAPAPIGPIVITPNVNATGNNVILIGTQPRFDQFEGP
ncbi:MAG: hypothetical protein ACT4UQ_09550 [Gammaproteobacteria bacterium]